ncbi:MAG: hypothetical protein IKX24_04340 [Prevotella sp.]|nr:hypothetical protein [Prevotella sp.]
MGYYILVIFACWLFVPEKAQGQEVTFLSPVVEEGIRQHLGLTECENIRFEQLDTITSLDLSRRGVTDIYDLVLLPKLRNLNLSDNMVDDLRPLNVLDSLEWVDLRFNSLKGINELMYANAKKMTVNVAFNYIKDFSLFGSMSSCNFILEGALLQIDENAPYFDVSQFICDASESPAVIHGLVRTNMEGAARLECEGENIGVPAEGEFFKQSLRYDGKATVQVILTNGEQGDTTWLVPLQTYQVEAGKTVTIESGLPEDYTIQGFTPALQGTMQIDGTSLSYNASNGFEYEKIMYGFYRNGVFKGIAKVILTSEGLSEGLDEVTLTDGIDMAGSQSSSLKVSYHDNVLNVRCMSETLADESFIDVFDVSGKVLSTKRVDSRHGIDEQISIGRLPKPAIIVRVRSGNKVYSEKLLTL